MAIKDVQEWNDLIAQVSATRGVEASAVTAINNIADKLAALAAGAVSLADLKTAVAEQTGLLKDSATPLAAAVARDPDSAPPAA